MVDHLDATTKLGRAPRSRVVIDFEGLESESEREWLAENLPRDRCVDKLGTLITLPEDQLALLFAGGGTEGPHQYENQGAMGQDEAQPVTAPWPPCDHGTNDIDGEQELQTQEPRCEVDGLCRLGSHERLDERTRRQNEDEEDQ